MNIKKIALIVLIALIFVYILALNFIWQKYTNDELGFSIMLPRLWYKQEGAFNAVVIAKAPQTDKNDIFQENINVTVSYLPAGMDIDTYYELNKNAILEMLPSEPFDIQEGKISASGDTGRFLALSSAGPLMVMRTMSALWIKNKIVYVVTCFGQDSEFSKYEPIFKKSIRSIRFFKPKPSQ